MEWWQIAVLAVCGLIMLAIAMSLVNRRYKRKYNYSLYPGGFFMLLSIGCTVLGSFITADKPTFRIGLIIIGGVGFAIILLTNIKRCGAAAGICAMLLQVIFGAASVFAVFKILAKDDKPAKRGLRTKKSSTAANRYNYQEQYRGRYGERTTLPTEKRRRV